MSRTGQCLKVLPVVGPVAIGIHRVIQYLGRLGIFGISKRREANLRFFRKCLADMPLRFENPVFVKVGANDGLTQDPCSDLLVAEPSWQGLFIEPVPYLFDRLKHNLGATDRFAFEPAAIGPVGAAILHYIDPSAREAFPDLPAWFDQIGSLDRGHIHKHFGRRLDAYLREQQVQIVPLQQILEKHGIQTVHLLHVDTEGYDYKVISTIDFERCQPEIVFVEHKHLDASDRLSLLRLLQAASYRVRDCGDDYFAIRR